MAFGKSHWIKKAHFLAPSTLLLSVITSQGAHLELARPQRFSRSEMINYFRHWGCTCDFTDLVITGKDETEYDGTLKLVLDQAGDNNVKFNPKKFQFRVSEVKYQLSYDPRSYEHNLCNCVYRSLKKYSASMGFGPATSPHRCDALSNWAMKPLTLRAGQPFAYHLARLCETGKNQTKPLVTCTGESPSRH